MYSKTLPWNYPVTFRDVVSLSEFWFPKRFKKNYYYSSSALNVKHNVLIDCRLNDEGEDDMTVSKISTTIANLNGLVLSGTHTSAYTNDLNSTNPINRRCAMNDFTGREIDSNNYFRVENELVDVAHIVVELFDFGIDRTIKKLTKDKVRIPFPNVFFYQIPLIPYKRIDLKLKDGMRTLKLENKTKSGLGKMEQDIEFVWINKGYVAKLT